MLRKLLYVSIAVLFGLAVLQGCNDSNDDHSDGVVGRSYVYGTLDGTLASQLSQVFSPRVWREETDGPVLMPANSLPGLSESQKTALRTLIRGGHALLLTRSTHDHIKGIHALTGSPAAVSLDQTPLSHSTVELYGLAEPGGLMRMIMVPPFPTSPDPEPESSKEIRATSVANWLLENVRGGRKQTAQLTAQSSTGNPYPLSADSLPWVLSIQETMPAYWSTCSLKTQQCVNNVQLNIGAWMVYSSSAPAGQPSDFFIVQMSSDINTAGCREFYGDRNHSNRIAGYWLRQANMSALVQGVSFSEFNIPASYYAPVSANPSTTNTTGVTWSLSGSGSAGFNSTGPTGSVGFSAGVSYKDERTASYQAIATKVNIGADTANPARASWTYDSWDFVDNNIRPSNHACPNGLRKTEALPPIIYGSAFSPVQSWVWAAQPSIRTKFSGNTLPVKLDASLLLGWTYYSTDKVCDAASTTYGSYYIGTDSYHPNTSVVGASGSISNGLNFDVSCGTHTILGTIPLGPHAEDDQHGSGNPGTPYPFQTWSVNIPFAPTVTVAPTLTLTALSPTSGSAGTTVTLTGTNLNAATTVNFGGTQVTNFSYKEPSIQVAAPTGTGTVQVSVGNASSTSNTFPFTYTP